MLKELEKNLTISQTDNGDISYTSTLNDNLNFFGKAGSLRGDPEEAIALFLKAYNEDKDLALRNLVHLRDIKGGYGERNLFREILYKLISYDDSNNDVYKVINAIPNIGRYDDIISLIPNPNKNAERVILSFIDWQLKSDTVNMHAERPISLLAKWMPSINTSSRETVDKAIFLAEYLFEGDKAKYRKTLSTLRNYLNILEVNLTNKDYTFDYNHVPGKALTKYTQAFRRNDEERYLEFIESLKEDNTKVRTKAEKLMPYEIVRLYNSDKELADTLWDSLDKTSYNSNTIIVRDGSGSMTCGLVNAPRPIDIADALTIYMSERINGEMNNKFITFSSEPELVKLNSDMTLSQKVETLQSYNDISNTNIQKTYDILYETNKALKPEERIDNVIVVSDMQFDWCVSDEEMSTFEYLKKKFEDADIKLPKMVYWDVGVASAAFTTQDLEYVQYVSGFSKNIFEKIVNNIDINAYGLMVEKLSEYDYIFE